MSTILYVILFSFIGGLISFAGAALLISKESVAQKMAFYATPFAAGALLAAVFLDLLKEGISEAENVDSVLYAALLGILIFFFAERFLRWFHHHHQHDNADPTIPLIITGDTLHNALDGVAIAAAFLVSIPTGIVTTIAVAAHEIPQEAGDFGLLLKKGMARGKVLLVNFISALATVAAAVVTYTLGDTDRLPSGILLGLSAGFLLYIALSDIIPLLHEETNHKRFFDWQPALLLLGLIVVALSIQIAHDYIDVEPEHEHIRSELHTTQEHLPH